MFNHYYISRIVLFIILVAFTLTASAPMNTESFQGSSYETVFVRRIQKLVKKMWKLEKSKDTGKMYAIAATLKREIENYCGIEINIDEHLNTVTQQLKNFGLKNPKRQIYDIRKSILKKQKKYDQYAHYDGSFMGMGEDELEEMDREILMLVPEAEEEEEEETHVPTQLVFGVTLTLCGFFLMVIPFSVCRPWGEKMITSGFVVCGNAISGKTDNDKKNEKGRK